MKKVKDYHVKTPLLSRVDAFKKEEGKVDFSKLYAIIISTSITPTHYSPTYTDYYTFIFNNKIKVEHVQEKTDYYKTYAGACKTLNLQCPFHAKALEKLKSIDFSKWNSTAEHYYGTSSNPTAWNYCFIDENGIWYSITSSTNGNKYYFENDDVLKEVLLHVDKWTKALMITKKIPKITNTTDDDNDDEILKYLK